MKTKTDPGLLRMLARNKALDEELALKNQEAEDAKQLHKHVNWPRTDSALHLARDNAIPLLAAAYVEHQRAITAALDHLDDDDNALYDAALRARDVSKAALYAVVEAELAIRAHDALKPKSLK